ncbi:MAG: DUF2855 family protein [Saprospiraceae bacterium]
MPNHSLLIHKTDLYQVRQQESPNDELGEGEVLFKVDKYALTTNNITYAVSGFKLKYWDFFPVEEPWGIVPVWGYGEVVASRHSAIATGERCYGYFPMSSYLKVEPGKVNVYGFSDIAAHRAGLASIYNYYSRIAADPSFTKEIEDYFPIIKPLFATSFLIYYFLKEEAFFGAEQIAITSASSKTGLALAFMLKQNQALDHKKVIGLTSAANVEFVQSTGYYDQVITYETYAEKMPQVASVIVDFAGKTALLHEMASYLSDHLKHIALIGLTDWKSTTTLKGIPKAAFFFAPTHIQNKYKEWGPEKTNLMLNTALVKFITAIKQLIEIEFIEDLATLGDRYLEMLDGKVDPQKGYIVQVKEK